ncbi:hypothetical protein [Bacillus sp. T33-2]|uniref:hypothetical protein n=1 Tax=Bacillus sp. T33-2 TaxID=2054168 RepID=UPI000C78491C|nr:hypothetical protein [Bacillus sp. T33-2]PLR99662.1 hypothetical protein CVD19_00965 [Bacillus sp. T33-2]
MPIVTEGLLGYWNYQQGINGSTWENLAPITKGTNNGTIFGATLQDDGLYFDGVDDYVEVLGNFPAAVTIEIIVSVSNVVNCAIVGYGAGTNRISIINSRNAWVYRGASRLLNSFPTIVANSQYYFAGSVSTANAIFNMDANTPITYASNYILSADTIFRMGGITGQPFFNGKIKVVRIYNRALTQAELNQNRAEGTNIGLETTPPSATPVVTIASTSRTKLSDEAMMDRSNITFKFDKDITAWEVRVLGTGQGTGTLAASGGSVSANTNIVAEVDWTELYQEGQNKINIYGQGTDGSWTPYDP